VGSIQRKGVLQNNLDPIKTNTQSNYLDGRFVGFDEEGIKAAIDAIRSLPAGTSVAWFTDPNKELSGPGGDPLPWAWFPKQWGEFHQVAKSRRLPVSSLGYWPHDDDEGAPRAEEYVEPGTPVQTGEVVLGWSPREQYDEWPIYSIDGRALGRRPDAFLATLKLLEKRPDGFLLRLRHADSGLGLGPPPGLWLFPQELQAMATAKRCRVVHEVKKTSWPAWANCPARCRFEWRNFESPATPRGEVVYLVDGRAVGMGDAGFGAVLKRIAGLPVGAYVDYPQYVLHGMAFQAELRAKFRSADMVPFAHRRKDLHEVATKARLVVGRTFVVYWPKPVYDDHVDRLEERRWFFRSLLRFATIIRDGRKPAPADIVVSWKRGPGEGKTHRSQADYFCNGEKVGSGTPGFLAALRRIEALPEGATVRIDPICVRTQGPFYDAVIMHGQRHFETTGEEPFRGLVDLLAETALKKRLRVEVVPDERPRG
jgi:hypothetical protein